ncbi:Isocitrate lyase [Salmonella enterica subsp. enterica]|uniref:Isocitrate lyase n=1 Tax=Salmonella enterica I TaxID=59201 RepID=A0A379WIB0_SALET|nr:Isocitrate lyase [Salmonella enterica subsp. enterica]
MKSMIEAGAAAVHFEDQLASVKKCGHMGGKVLVPTQEAIQKLVAARLAADVMGRPDAGDCAYRCGCGRSDHLRLRSL